MRDDLFRGRDARRKPAFERLSFMILKLAVVSRSCKGSWPCAEMGVSTQPSRKDHELVRAEGLAA
jgi:hypothetical protein